MPTSLQGGCGRAEGRPGKDANRSRSTLNNELIFFIWSYPRSVRCSGRRSLSNLGAHQGRPRGRQAVRHEAWRAGLDAAWRASIKARSEIADAFAANVRPIIREIQESGAITSAFPQVTARPA